MRVCVASGGGVKGDRGQISGCPYNSLSPTPSHGGLVLVTLWNRDLVLTAKLHSQMTVCAVGNK